MKDEHQHDAPSGTAVRTALILTAAAMIVRVVFLFASSDRAWPHSLLYEGDAPTWVVWAGSLDRGEAFEADLPIRSPAVAFVLHWLTNPDGVRSWVALKLAWCVLTSLGVGLTYLAARRTLAPRPALIAGWLCVFSFGQLAISTSLNNEAMYLFLLPAIVLATVAFTDRPRIWLALVLAVLHGLATLVRAEHTLLLALMLAYSAWRWRGLLRTDRRSLVGAGAMLALVAVGSVLVVLPWTIRGVRATAIANESFEPTPDYERAWPRWTDGAQASLDELPAFARMWSFRDIGKRAITDGRRSITVEEVERHFEELGGKPGRLSTVLLVSSQGPLSFALANHPDAGGGFSRAALVESVRARAGVEAARNAGLNIEFPPHIDLYNNGYARGIGYIREDPGAWLHNVGRKLAHFASGASLGFTPYNVPVGRDLLRRPVDVATPDGKWANAWTVCVVTVLLGGVARCIARRTGGVWLVVVLYKLFVTLAFYGYARQAVSISPALFALAAFAIDGSLVAIETRVRAVRVPIRALGWVLGALAFGASIAYAFDSARPQAVGEMRQNDDLVPGALLSFEPVRIRYEREP